jgi:hypothetical protein
MDFLSRKESPGVSRSDFVEQMVRIRSIAHLLLCKAQKTQAKYANKNRKPMEFQIGDKVWISTINVSTTRPCKKLDYKKIGPYEVIAKVGKVSYEVQLPRNLRIFPIFHVSLLEPYYEDPDPNRTKPPPPSVIINDEEEYEAEEILDSRFHYNKPQYKVKWVGYTIDDASWEPAKFLKHSPKLMDAFHSKYPSKPGPFFKRGSM